MTPKDNLLTNLIETAVVTTELRSLESYLAQHSNLPGPRANIALIGQFADAIGDMVKRSQASVEFLERLLDGWATLSLEDAPINHPREILPACAVLAYGQVAVSRPDWWTDEIAKLRKAAKNPRWRTREMVAAGLQRMLKADWPRAIADLYQWLEDEDPLVLRAAAAGVAEPPLLKDVDRGKDALALQKTAVDWLASLPAERRAEENVRVLRQALGYTVSVAVAAAPETGFELLEHMASTDNPDLHWIVRENLKKKRLSHWPDRIAALETMLSG
jgi:hypothetical protein